ncbi:hypothetical protein EMIT0P74_30341 [Pseudomonas sp. IT-P74]
MCVARLSLMGRPSANYSPCSGEPDESALSDVCARANIINQMAFSFLCLLELCEEAKKGLSSELSPKLIKRNPRARLGFSCYPPPAVDENAW